MFSSEVLLVGEFELKIIGRAEIKQNAPFVYILKQFKNIFCCYLRNQNYILILNNI